MLMLSELRKIIEQNPYIKGEDAAKELGISYNRMNYLLRSRHQVTFQGLRKEYQAPVITPEQALEFAKANTLLTQIEAAQHLGICRDALAAALQKAGHTWQSATGYTGGQRLKLRRKQGIAEVKAPFTVPEWLTKHIRPYRYTCIVYRNPEARL
jgi:hypothetical protein